tara:strand:- start:275 stop:490 length:216 start_codon:yes stop_codon:yes gene_type:complete
MKELTPSQLDNIKDLYVTSIVDNMDIKTLVQYVTDSMWDYVSELPEAEFLDEAKNYWEDSFNQIIEDYTND